MVTEQVSKVAISTIDALKAQPLLLVIVLVNVLSLLTAAYVLHEVSNATERKDQLLMEMVKQCAKSP
jgi:hypothetical protein